MNIKSRVEKLEVRCPRMLLAVVGEGEDHAQAATRCRAVAGVTPRQPMLLVFTGVPRPKQETL